MLVLSLTIFGANLVRKASTFMGMAILITAVSIYTLGSFQGENFVTVLTKDFGSCGFKTYQKQF